MPQIVHRLQAGWADIHGPRLALNEIMRCTKGSLVVLAPVCTSFSPMCLDHVCVRKCLLKKISTLEIFILRGLIVYESHIAKSL